MASQASNDTTPNAKQLVFLFMAATVVAVVVFLCGVLVGRGVPSAGRSTGPALGPFGEAALDENARRPPILDVVSSEPSAAASSGDDLSYYRRARERGPGRRDDPDRARRVRTTAARGGCRVRARTFDSAETVGCCGRSERDRALRRSRMPSKPTGPTPRARHPWPIAFVRGVRVPGRARWPPAQAIRCR